MTISIFPNAFESEEDAIATLQQDNLWILAQTEGPSQFEAHWHNFDVHLCLLSGVVRITEVISGHTYVCVRGTKLVLPARTVHTETSPGMSYVMGLSVDPETLAPPINRLPTEQIAA